MTVAGSFSNYLENKLIDHLFGVATYTPASTRYLALSSTDPLDDGSGKTEPSGNGYARAKIAFWPSTSRAASNMNDVIFPKASGSWGSMLYWMLYDAATSGNMLAHGKLSSTLSVGSGDWPRLRNSEIVISLNKCRMLFTSGGTVTPAKGDIITGHTSGAVAVVVDVEVTSGSWGAGTAAGSLGLISVSGVFVSETLDIGANVDVATTDGELFFGFSDYLAPKVLDFVLRGSSLTIAGRYAALSTAHFKSDGSGAAEPSASGYARAAVSSWRTAFKGYSKNSSQVTYTTPTGSWGALTHIALYDAATAGNLLFYGKLSTSRSPVASDSVVISTDALEIRIDVPGEPQTTTTTTTTTTSSTTTTTSSTTTTTSSTTTTTTTA